MAVDPIQNMTPAQAGSPSRPSPSRLGTRRVRRRTVAAALAVFTIAFGALRVASYVRKSATWDEPVHLVAGYAALRGDDRVDPSHPPLMRMWAALPLVAMPGLAWHPEAIDRSPRDRWLTGPDSYAFARTFLYRDNDADAVLDAARFMMVLVGIAGGWLVFFWAYEWLGFRAAACALLFYAISPNITANASLVTTDIGESVLFMAALYAFWRMCRRPTWGRQAAFVVAVALAVVTKFSGLVLAPIVACLLVAAVWRARLNWRQGLQVSAALVVATLVAIWAVYGFRYAPSDNPTWLFQVDDAYPSATLSPLVGWVDDHHLLPNAFTEGALFCVTSATHAAYLMGEVSPSGWWYYFPVAFAVKTPVALLALFAVGLIVGLRQARVLGRLALACLLGPAAVFFACAMASGVNIGLRHVLPVYPCVVLVAALAADRLLALPRLVPRAAVVVVVGGWIWSYASVYPNSLTFFNVLAGGPEHGLDYLADSNLDWGQHLKSLKHWMDRQGVSHINLAYFGQADPAYYHIDATLLPGTMLPGADAVAKPTLPGYVAISATMLSGVYLPPAWRMLYDAFRDRAPAAEIGHSIYVYWVDQWPEGAAADDPDLDRELADYLASLHWRSHAVRHYQRYLAARPGDAAARARLAATQLEAGETDQAIATLRAAAASAPANGEIWDLLGAVLLDHGTPTAARPAIVQAVSCLPQDAVTRDLYGRLLAAEGRFADAAVEFERALALDPKLVSARDHLTAARARLASHGAPSTV